MSGSPFASPPMVLAVGSDFLHPVVMGTVLLKPLMDEARCIMEYGVSHLKEICHIPSLPEPLLPIAEQMICIYVHKRSAVHMRCTILCHKGQGATLNP